MVSASPGRACPRRKPTKRATLWRGPFLQCATQCNRSDSQGGAKAAALFIPNGRKPPRSFFTKGFGGDCPPIPHRPVNPRPVSTGCGPLAYGQPEDCPELRHGRPQRSCGTGHAYAAGYERGRPGEGSGGGIGQPSSASRSSSVPGSGRVSVAERGNGLPV